MPLKDASLKIESFLRFIYDNEEKYTSEIEAHPCEEILCALTKAKALYPAKGDIIQFYINRHKNMSDNKLETLIKKGYNIEGLISDLNRLKEILIA